MSESLSSRTGSVRWWICGLMFLATVLNYLDRLTLNQTAARVMDEFAMSKVQYGQTEGAFGLAYALGSLGFGWLIDRFDVRRTYAVAVLGWSAAGAATAWASDWPQLLIFRFLLGFFEAGHFPCALRVTLRLLDASERPLGNGIIQSGTAIGGILAPLVILALVRQFDTWRAPFVLIGGVGVVWVAAWLILVTPHRLGGSTASPSPTWPAVVSIISQKRFWTLGILLVGINCTWHFYRAWLPLFLQRVHGYSETETAWGVAGFNLAADGGSLTAGFLALTLSQRWGLTPFHGRLLVYLGGATLCLVSLGVAGLPPGWLLWLALGVVAFGSLALFPLYYSFAQELSERNQGKVSGLLSCLNWTAMAAFQPLIGWVVETGGQPSGQLSVFAAGFPAREYAPVLMLVGGLPLFGGAVFWLGWRSSATPTRPLS